MGSSFVLSNDDGHQGPNKSDVPVGGIKKG